MPTIAKGVIEGAWALIVGWILPCAIALLQFGLLVRPSLDVGDVKGGSLWPLNGEDAGLLASAVVLGWLLAALSTPLYRVLEGYALWPERLRERRIRHHQQVRRDLQERADSAVGSLQCAAADETLYSYPLCDDEVLPTRLGNVIRGFECYGRDRYQLDAVGLWPHLMSSVPEAVMKEANQARAGVDFFVALLYGEAALCGAAMTTLAITREDSPRLLAAAALGAVTAALSYRAAITATATWAASVRAVVDLGRLPLAAAYGLRIPDSLGDERRMWEALAWFVGYPYDPEDVRNMDEFRVRQPGSSLVEHRPPGEEQGSQLSSVSESGPASPRGRPSDGADEGVDRGRRAGLGLARGGTGDRDLSGPPGDVG